MYNNWTKKSYEERKKGEGVMKVKSFVKGTVSALLAAGVALSCASVANAASATYYPRSAVV
ncbi:hypothetical protein CGZ88_0570 [Bifidobacterium anseris]|uniref:Uncharacterized protein n=1 Tax=Bifidobacterium anseris TaxID=2020963 RepID=A0A2N5J2I1_9BIFI|nr:hypothetical protein [Bifidobacterium anseris]PLS28408.1 hypothetical protein CGZ88_0570 [Bifidobacterium anseris]